MFEARLARRVLRGRNEQDRSQVRASAAQESELASAQWQKRVVRQIRHGGLPRALQSRAKAARARAAAWLTSGQVEGKTSVPWMVPMAWTQRAATPARTSRR